MIFHQHIHNYHDQVSAPIRFHFSVRLETQEGLANGREGKGIVMVTVEGNEKYLCYDNTWSEELGDAICNEYGFGWDLCSVLK